MNRFVLPAAILLALSAPAQALEFSADDINAASFEDGAVPSGQSALAAKIQIMLDRAGASPGVIDGYLGDNVEKAIFGFEAINGLTQDGKMDGEIWSLLAPYEGGVMTSYTITEEDASGLSAPLPSDYAELAKLDRLGYTSVAEKLSEKFHMDQEFLENLNAGSDFSPGSQIMVADPGTPKEAEVARLVADKSRKWLVAYDAADFVIAVYPVTIGSRSNPSPSGTHTVQAIAIDPTYTYNPDLNFKQGDNDKVLVLPPGPNGPVGNVWIDLSEPTYGIHGSPNPDIIDKTASYGCVRMTNWDAMELAHNVDPGVVVEFKE